MKTLVQYNLLLQEYNFFISPVVKDLSLASFGAILGQAAQQFNPLLLEENVESS